MRGGLLADYEVYLYTRELWAKQGKVSEFPFNRFRAKTLDIARSMLWNMLKNHPEIHESDWEYPTPRKEYGKVMRIQCDYFAEKNAYRYIWVTDKGIRELTPAGNFKR